MPYITVNGTTVHPNQNTEASFGGFTSSKTTEGYAFII